MARGTENNSIRFRRTDHIGFADAESDDLYLNACFVDTGDLAILRDCSDPRCIILGRTGSGKTALLKRLKDTEHHTYELFPERLSIDYISNSNVIAFFEAVGVNLDVFFKLLWNHVISVELIRRKFEIYNEAKKNSFLDFIHSALRRDRSKEKAVEYLERWGNKFWDETELRAKELTETITTSLEASAGLSHELISLGAKGAETLTAQQKSDIVARGRKVLDGVQIRDLSAVIDLLADDIFTDNQNKYFLVIDRLDEEWADEAIRYRLIKALIESIKTFKRIRSVKIVMALRIDLKEKLFRETTGPGFQEEKYKSMYLGVGWSRGDLKAVLDQRVSHLCEHQYTRHNVFLSDILPSQGINGRSSTDFILDRTFLRPREAIIFLNQAIEKAEGYPRITIGQLKAAEISYSKERLLSLEQEWRIDYPILRRYAFLFEHRKSPIPVHELVESADDFVAQILGDDAPSSTDPIYMACVRYMDSKMTAFEVIREVLSNLYRVGMIGLKLDTHTSRQWSFIDDPVILPQSITQNAGVEVHLTFWPVLGISKRENPPKRQ